jgi:magnesium-transporting ATPase (P-type)
MYLKVIDGIWILFRLVTNFISFHCIISCLDDQPDFASCLSVLPLRFPLFAFLCHLLLFLFFFTLFSFPCILSGLPTTVTTCLYIVADSMKKENVFVKKLDIIETLGSCTCICTDKTGTLTMNQMSVANAWTFNQAASSAEIQKQICGGQSSGKEVTISPDTAKLEAPAAEDLPRPSSVTPPPPSNVSNSNVNSTNSNTTNFATSPQFKKLMEIAILNSRVVLEKKEGSDDLVPTSDATEVGFYNFFSQFTQQFYGSDIESFRKSHPKLLEIPFNSAFKWQMTIHNLESEDGKQFLLFKGNPAIIHYLLSRFSTRFCAWYFPFVLHIFLLFRRCTRCSGFKMFFLL